MSRVRIKRSEFNQVRKVDESPDLSWLGEYDNEPGENAIDREAIGDRNRGEYRYCNVTMSAADTGNPDSVQQDYNRLEAYNRGEWCMIGIWAEVRVYIAGVMQIIRSGGLWGIESDSEESYSEQVYAEQCDELANILADMGFDVIDDRHPAAADEEIERFDLCD